MKTKIKLPAKLFLFAGILLCLNKVSAQTTIFNTPFLFPTRDEIWSATTYEQIVGGGTSEVYLKGFGLNNYFQTAIAPARLPHFMLDVYCDPSSTGGGTLTDINISCPNCTPSNAVGYRIGEQMVMWCNC